jgi:hypothetical protein
MLPDHLPQPEKRLQIMESKWAPEGAWKLLSKERPFALVGNPTQTRRSSSLHNELFQN